MTQTIEFAPFCPLALQLSSYQAERKLVGAVGIENKTKRSVKDLEEMRKSAKTLRRHSEELKRILIGPSTAPRFLRD